MMAFKVEDLEKKALGGDTPQNQRCWAPQWEQRWWPKDSQGLDRGSAGRSGFLPHGEGAP